MSVTIGAVVLIANVVLVLVSIAAGLAWLAALHGFLAGAAATGLYFRLVVTVRRAP